MKANKSTANQAMLEFIAMGKSDQNKFLNWLNRFLIASPKDRKKMIQAWRCEDTVTDKDAEGTSV